MVDYSGDGHEVFTATAGWVRVTDLQDGGWNVVNVATQQAARARFIGADDPTQGLRAALQHVGVSEDEAPQLAAIICAGGDVG